jgi:hypothetical protein
MKLAAKVAPELLRVQSGSLADMSVNLRSFISAS